MIQVNSGLVACAYNEQHRVPSSKIKIHEEICQWRSQGYHDNDKLFPDHSKQGSFVIVNSDLLNEITTGVLSAPVGK